jgi:hypothetical protein
MTTTTKLITAANLSALKTAVNGVLAPLLSHRILGLTLVPGDRLSRSGLEFAVSLLYDDSGASIANPYQIEIYSGTGVLIEGLYQEAITAAPGAFWTLLQPGYLLQSRQLSTYAALAVTNASLSEGRSNWVGDGGGGAGASLAGDATGPAGANTVEKIRNVDVSATAPTNQQALIYDGTSTAWSPTTLDPTIVVLDSDTISIDMDGQTLGATLGTVYRRTTAGNVTLNEPSNMPDGATIRIEFTQGGGHTLSFSGTNWAYVGGIQPDLSPDADSVDVAYITRSGSTFYLTWVAADGDPAYQFGNQIALTNSVANVIDSFSVDDFRGARWQAYLEDTTNGAYAEFDARYIHDGDPSTDATAASGSAAGTSLVAEGFTVSADVSGAGANQILRLLVTPPATGTWTVSFERTAGGPQ